MPFFRRRAPLHERLAREGGLGSLTGPTQAPGLAAETPGWDGLQRGEPGIHGVPRARRWDVVATTEADGLGGDTVHFVAPGDGSLLVEENEPDEPVRRLADAVEQTIAPPYRAEAVRRGRDTWAVAARRIQVVEERGLRGNEVELVFRPEGWSARVDGEATLRRAPALERVGEELGSERVIRAWRLAGDLWEVEAAPL